MIFHNENFSFNELFILSSTFSYIKAITRISGNALSNNYPIMPILVCINYLSTY